MKTTADIAKDFGWAPPQPHAEDIMTRLPTPDIRDSGGRAWRLGESQYAAILWCARRYRPRATWFLVVQGCWRTAEPKGPQSILVELTRAQARTLLLGEGW